MKMLLFTQISRKWIRTAYEYVLFDHGISGYHLFDADATARTETTFIGFDAYEYTFEIDSDGYNYVFKVLVERTNGVILGWNVLYGGESVLSSTLVSLVYNADVELPEVQEGGEPEVGGSSIAAAEYEMWVSMEGMEYYLDQGLTIHMTYSGEEHTNDVIILGNWAYSVETYGEDTYETYYKIKEDGSYTYKFNEDTEEWFEDDIWKGIDSRIELLTLGAFFRLEDLGIEPNETSENEEGSIREYVFDDKTVRISVQIGLFVYVDVGDSIRTATYDYYEEFDVPEEVLALAGEEEELEEL